MEKESGRYKISSYQGSDLECFLFFSFLLFYGEHQTWNFSSWSREGFMFQNLLVSSLDFFN